MVELKAKSFITELEPTKLFLIKTGADNNTPVPSRDKCPQPEPEELERELTNTFFMLCDDVSQVKISEVKKFLNFDQKKHKANKVEIFFFLAFCFLLIISPVISAKNLDSYLSTKSLAKVESEKNFIKYRLNSVLPKKNFKHKSPKFYKILFDKYKNLQIEEGLTIIDSLLSLNLEAPYYQSIILFKCLYLSKKGNIELSEILFNENFSYGSDPPFQSQKIRSMYFHLYSYLNYQRNPKNYLLRFEYAITQIKEDYPDLFEFYILYSDCAAEAGDYKRAFQIIENAKNLRKISYPKDTLNYIKLQMYESILHFYSGNPSLAIKNMENKVSRLLLKNHSNQKILFDFQACEFYRLSALFNTSLSNYSEIIKNCHLFLQNASKFYSPNSLKYGEVFRDLASAYYSTKRFESYIKYNDKAIAILSNYKYYYKEIEKYAIKGFLYKKKYDSCIIKAENFIKKYNDAPFHEKYNIIELKMIALLYKKDYYGMLKFANELIYLNDNFLKQNRINDLTYNIYTYQLIGLSKLDSIQRLNILRENYLLSDNIEFGKRTADNIIRDKLHLKNTTLCFYYILFANFCLENRNWKVKYDKVILAIIEFWEDQNARDFSENKLLSLAYALRSKCFQALYESDGDITHLENAIDAIKRSNFTLSSQLNRNFSIEDMEFAINVKMNLETNFTNLLKLLSSKSSIKLNSEIFSLLERYKASLVEIHTNKQKAIIDSLLPEKIKEEVLNLKTQINSIEKKLKKEKQSSKFLIEQLNLSKDRLKILYSNLGQVYDRNFNLIPKIDLDDCLQQLEKQSVLLYFFETYTLAISPSKTKFLKLPALPDSIIQKFRNSLNPSDIEQSQEKYKNYISSAYEIYQSQLKPILDEFPDAKKLYIIPDGNLHQIPFEALISELPKSNIVNYKDLNYLVKDYTISYAYSATTLFKSKSLLNRLRTPGNKVLAFAPSYDQVSNSIGDQIAGRANRSVKQPLSNIRGTLYPLEYNTKEVDNIKPLFDGNYRKNAEATEADFKRLAADHDILHLSMHAVVDPDDPMYSYLAFTPDPRDSTNTDGFLHAFEIYDMDLNAEMAVLSACNTGHGKIYKGEGPMSLAKAFTYAGCPSVVMSYWPADDKSSSEIMASFYAYLAKGKKKDEALRQAKLDFLENAPPIQQAPANWNNFVVLGDVSPIVPDRTKLYLVIAAIVICFLALCYTGYRFYPGLARKFS